jgi:Ion transport protein
MQVSLKIAGNIEGLANQAQVKDFFFSKFRRQIIKKNLIEKIHKKVDQCIIESELLIRSKYSRILLTAFIIQRAKWFHLITMLVIVANSIVLGMSRYPIDETKEQWLEYANLAFFAYFVLELIVKLVGQGFKHFFRENYNIFDCIVVLSSAIDIAI